MECILLTTLKLAKVLGHFSMSRHQEKAVRLFDWFKLMTTDKRKML